MSSDVLRTKLYIPQQKPTYVVRARLIARLDESLRKGQHVVLASAPAGFGKSTLISQWIRAGLTPAAWITLDESDNDPVRLWRHLVAALAELPCVSCESLSAFLNSPQPPAFKSLAAALINTLAELDRALFIVLDDYHTLENGEIHQGMSYLLERLPERVSMCILTRADPPLNISRLRGRGELCEIRAADLRFDPDETGDFFNEKMKLGLPARDLNALTERTEGWIAGLQMAGLSLQAVTDRHAFVAAFSGDDRHIADYLIDEVLSHQPAEIQEFLRTTSILDRMCAPLCDYLTGRTDSQMILNLLDRANLFVIPLDNRREWFRYHHLFASLLRQNLIYQNGQEHAAMLRRRVVDWYESNGYLEDAIEMALSGSEYVLAAEMIEKVVDRLMSGSELTTLLKWARLLPASILQRHPRLCLFFAWSANATGRPKECIELINHCEQALGRDVRSLLADPAAFTAMDPVERNQVLEIASIYIRLEVDNLNFPRVFALSEMVLPYLCLENDAYPYICNPPSALFAPMRMMQGILYQVLSRLDEATAAFEDCVHVSADPRMPNSHTLALGYSHLGEVMLIRGRLDDAAANFHSALAAARANPQSTSVFFSLSMAGLGLVEFERGNRAEARSLFQDAIRMGQLWNHWDTLIPAALGLARLEVACGCPQQAARALESLNELLAADLPPALPLTQGMLAWLQALAGSPAAGIAWAAQVEAEPVSHAYYLEHGAWLRAMVLLAVGDAPAALRVLDPAITEAELQGKKGKLTALFACRAAALHQLRRNDPASLALRTALDYAREQGAFQSIAGLAGPLRDLLLSELRACAGQNDPARTALIRRLLGAASPAGSSPSTPVTQEWEEPLSEREIEVLSCMALGLSNSQTAARLVVAPNTIKKHVGNIFAKLNVTSRIAAVEKGRQKNLIP